MGLELWGAPWGSELVQLLLPCTVAENQEGFICNAFAWDLPSAHTALSGAASTAQPFRLGRFSHLLFTNNSPKPLLKSTHHAPSRQTATKLVATEKGNKQLMLESIQAPGFMFSPTIRRGCVKNKTHKPLVKYTLLLPIYLFLSNCLRRYKYHNI